MPKNRRYDQIVFEEPLINISMQPIEEVDPLFVDPTDESINNEIEDESPLNGFCIFSPKTGANKQKEKKTISSDREDANDKTEKRDEAVKVKDEPKDFDDDFDEEPPEEEEEEDSVDALAGALNQVEYLCPKCTFRSTVKEEVSQHFISSHCQAKKSNAQKMKEYRKRKKLRQLANSAVSSQEASPPKKTNAQKMKEYRERKKLKQLLSVTSTVPSQETRDKNAQMKRDYRNRLAVRKIMLFNENEPLRKKAKESNILKNYIINSQTAGPSRIPYIDKTDKRYSVDYTKIKSNSEINDNFSDNLNNFTNSDYNVAINAPIDERIAVNEDDSNADNSELQNFDQTDKYTNYYQHAKGHLDFINNFKKISFGHSCAICDRLWWKNDLKTTNHKHEKILQDILPNYVVGTNVDICSTCKAALDKEKIPLLSTYNGFTYPTIPSYLSELDLVSQRLISPRIPFMQIRRLRHVDGQNGIYGQIINVAVSVNTMVHQLPRDIDDDHCFYVHIKKKLIHKSSHIHGLVNKQKIKEWLTYLVETPLYIHHNITIDDTFFNGDNCNEVSPEFNIDEISEHISVEDNCTAQQQTLLWNEDAMLQMAPGENNVPISKLFDEYAEELSFPTIYGGQFRQYKEGLHITPFIQATSELRRTDRRGADPQHLLYLATKIMRLRLKESIAVAFKHIGTDTKITKEQIQDERYITGTDTNLAFLRCIPNSVWYWQDRKKDLFAIMRQIGAPTAFMTLSANETGWNDLLKLLYKLKNNGSEISDDDLSTMSCIHKAKLVNEDAITSAIYFNKLVNTLLHILHSKKRSPFGKYRVVHYFERIEFQHQGSPQAHVFLWLENAPNDLLSNNIDVISMIDELVSVSSSEASGNIELQTHKHSFNCYKKMDPNKKDNCRFGAPFFPSRETVTLLPMKDTDIDYSEDFKKHFTILRENLENFDYTDFDDFYSHNDIDSDQHYHNIIRAGINRPTLLYKRSPSEKWHNPFNPFVFYSLESNMDFQIIQDEYACAAYIVEYINKSNRGISNLQQKIIEVMDENSEFDIVEITRKMSVDILHSVEMSAQEAAWYLLRMPMTKSTIGTVYIPTIWPVERQKIRKTMKELEAKDDDCTEIWKENWFDKYEKRPEELNNVTLAQFVSIYCKNHTGEYVRRKDPKIIRYRNYDINEQFNDYRREMVLLHIPFRNEENDILAENKFVQIYEDNKDIILLRRKEFESNLDIEKTMEICRQLYRDPENEDEEEPNINDNFEKDPYENLLS